MTDHLRPLLESVEDTTRFWRFSQDLVRAEVPEEIVDAIRLGRRHFKNRMALFAESSLATLFVVLWPGPSLSNSLQQCSGPHPLSSVPLRRNLEANAPLMQCRR